MKRSIPFELFGQNQTIYFDIPRLLEFEKAIGRSLGANSFLANPNLSFNETICGLVIGMKHHYHKATLDFYSDKIAAYMDETGSGLDEIADLVLRAITASGVYGKRIDDAVNGKQGETTEKNS